ncbi:MAG TPA: hypothetical protein VFI13_09695 [Gemmatimonadales bacterium]|nr:hypothetical protein [Gemmatimonadales bacterium]
MPPVAIVKAFGPPELSFVRASMQALAGGRRGCEHCHRTPLLGETIYLYGERFVCELCRPLRREAPGRAEVVHSAERDHTVKRRFAA